VVLFIHPKEVRRALGTAPLLKLCLHNLVVYENDRFPEPKEDPELHRALCDGGYQPVLVCPGPKAEELRPPTLATAEGEAVLELVPVEPPRTLIFVDGRWPQAKAMVNRSEWLKGIPRVVLVPTEQSGYKFRKQPEQGCLSTLEAVGEALLALEGSRGPSLKAALLAPFHRMVDLQCDFIPEAGDKNARLVGPAGRPRGEGDDDRLYFDLAAARRHPSLAQPSMEAHGPNPSQRPALHCIARWGEKHLAGRAVVVVEIIRAPLEDVKRRARQLSEGKVHGQRCWVTNPEKVLHGSPCEAPQGVPLDQLSQAQDVAPVQTSS